MPQTRTPLAGPGIRPLLTLLALLLLPTPSASDGLVTAIYKCTEADFLACDAELKLCLANRYVREDIQRQCEQCYTAAYVCQNDCDKRFAPTFGKACADACSPQYAAACNPGEYIFTEESGAPAVRGSSAAGLGFAVVAAAAALVVFGGG